MASSPGRASSESDAATYNAQWVQFVRDDWIRAEMSACESEFTSTHPTNVVIGTWNVNGKKPPDELSEQLHEWLRVPAVQNIDAVSSPPPPDLVVVGFQEMVDLTAVNVATSSKSGERSASWQSCLGRALSRTFPQAAYELVAAKHLVGILLLVYAREEHMGAIRGVQTCSAGVGVLGMMGNKGGVSARLRFHDSTICFVCAHMAAHRENVAGRNADYRNIIKRSESSFRESADEHRDGSLSLGRLALTRPTLSRTDSSGGAGEGANAGEGIADGSAAVGQGLGALSRPPPLLHGALEFGILDHDFVFWLGDLNYRIAEHMETAEVLSKAEAGEAERELLEQNDQLRIELAHGRAFNGFHEGKLTFKPTYKYQPGTDIFEQRPDKKLRAPAWCDRILWRVAQGTAAEAVPQLLHYGSRDSFRMSDHKPVHALFRMGVKSYDGPKRLRAREAIMARLNAHERATAPRIEITGQRVMLGDVRFGVPVSRVAKLCNRGGGAASWWLVPKMSDPPTETCKSWLKVEPTYGTVLPGEEMELRLTACVGLWSARALSNGQDTLDDVLALRIEGAVEQFVTVSGRYLVSCCGSSLHALVETAEPIRSSPLQVGYAHGGLVGNRPSGAAQAPLHVPKELWRMIDALYSHARVPALFVEAGDDAEVTQIIESLDTSSAFAPYSPHSMAEALKRFVAGLPESLVPLSLCPPLDHREKGAASAQSLSDRFLAKASDVQFNVFVYLMSFLRELLGCADHNHATAQKIATAFGRCVAQSGEAQLVGEDAVERTSQFLVEFLER